MAMKLVILMASRRVDSKEDQMVRKKEFQMAGLSEVRWAEKLVQMKGMK
jgi:hypothetical protein